MKKDFINKTKEYIRKHNTVCTLSLVTIIMIFLATAVYIGFIKSAATTSFNVTSITYDCGDLLEDNLEGEESAIYNNPNLVELKSGDTFTQTFISSRKTICGVYIKLRTEYMHEDEIEDRPGSLDVNVYNNITGELIGNDTVLFNEINGIFYRTINFYEMDKDAKGNEYRVEIIVNSIDNNEPAYIEVSGQDNYAGGSLLYNGEEQINDIVLRAKGGINIYIRNVFIVLAIFSIICSVIIYYLIFMKKAQIETIYLAFAILFGIIFIALLPPETKPDEINHISTIYNYSNKLLGIGDVDTSEYEVVTEEVINENGEIEVVEAKPGFYMYMREDDAKPEFAEFPNTRIYLYEYDEIFQRAENETLVPKEVELVETVPFVYSFAIMGLTIGRIFHRSTVFCYLLATLFNYIFFVAVTYFAIKKLPFGKMVLFAIAMFPAVIQQASSCSYDVVLLSLSFYLTAAILNLAYRDEKVKVKDIVIIAIICILITLVKNGTYAPFCLMILIVPKKQFKDKKSYYITMVAIILAVAGAFLFKNLGSAINIASAGGQSQGEFMVSWAGEPGYTLGYLLENPKEFLKVIKNTFFQNTDFYVETMAGSLLGWLSIPIMSPLIYGFIALMLIGTVTVKGDEKVIPLPAKAWIFITGWMCIGIFMMGMLLRWTLLESSAINGVQGRYFLPVLLSGALLLRTKAIKLDKSINKGIMVTAYILEMLVILSICRITLYV